MTQTEDAQKQGLQRMRRMAGGLLLVMTGVFLLSRYLEGLTGWYWMGFVVAFAEAAMVGGIADWFAVTALFRHPLGIPIPHTAIIPTKKDKIGESLGRFVENNFLTREVLSEKLQNLALSKKMEEWLAVPANSAMIADNVASFIPAIIKSLDDDDVRRFIENKLLGRATGQDVAAVAGNILTVLTANRKHDELFNELMKIALSVLEENKETIRTYMKKESPWFIPEFVNNKVYKKVVTDVDTMLDKAIDDPNHPMRTRFNEAIERFIEDLKNSPVFHEKIEELKNELLRNPVVRTYLDHVWLDLKTYIIHQVTQPDSLMREQIQKGVYAFFNSLVSDDALRQKISNWIYDTFLTLADKYRHEIGSVIASTIQKWDKETLSRKLELQVGKDLQYIRISGTVVGGAVGFFLHVIGELLRLIHI